jgi:prevent-host-death family protein
VRSDEARTHFRDLLDAAEHGEHITILRYEKPVAVLIPVEWHQETEEARTTERKRIAAFLRDEAAGMRRRGELLSAYTAEWMAGEIDPLGPVMGAPAAGGTT